MKIIKPTIFIFAFLFAFDSAQAVNASEFTLSISLKASTSVASKAVVAKAEELRMITNASGYPGCQINSGSTWQTAVVSSKKISIDTWSRITCSYNQKYLKIFIDGEETGSQALTTAVDDTSAVLKIGQDDSSGSSYDNLAGLVDDLKFYPYVLNEEEIKKDYNSGKAAVMGSGSTASDGVTKTNSKNRDYCVSGDTATCDPPVLELKMDEKSGVTAYDTSGNGNDGTISGASWGRGKLGSALDFDGSDDYVNAGNDASLNIGTGTVMAWVKPETLINSYPRLLSKESGTQGDSFALYINESTGSAHLYVASVYVVNSVTDFRNKLNEWAHIAVTLDGTTATMYIDGVYEDSAAHGIFPTTAYDLRIGSNPNSTRRFNGMIDDVKIYDYARTPAQIAYDYNKGKPIAHWSFDECSGSTIHDESGNGNHGTLNLGTSGVTATGTCASSSDSFWYNGVDGKINSSGSFDGLDNDYVNTNQAYDSTEYFISFWVNPDDISTEQYIIDQVPSNNRAVILGFQNGYFNYYDGDYPTGAEGDTQIRATLNTWQHIVMGTDGTNVYGYKNGELIFNEVGHWNVSTPTSLVIGNRGSFDYAFNGQIDEVKIWNYSLTAEQIKGEYNGGAVNFK